MKTKRRDLLKIGGGLPLLLGLPLYNSAQALSLTNGAQAQQAKAQLYLAEITDQVHAPAYQQNDLVLVDANRQNFTESGVYLYPAWGSPRPYLIKRIAEVFNFYHPATEKLLWQDSSAELVFAGQLIGRIESTAARARASQSFPRLELPALPE